MKAAVWILTVVIGCLLTGGIKPCMAQDPHFSQYYNSPLFQNPAYTGSFPGLMRFQFNYRSQWNSVTVPYQTMMASMDMIPGRNTRKKTKLGIGLSILRDKAGDSEYGIFNAGLNLAMHQTLNRRGTNVITIGGVAAFGQRSINYSALRFPEQFDGGSYNPGIPNGEQFPQTSLSYPDIGLGLAWNYNHRKTRYKLGFSIFHLNKPGLSFAENTDVRLEPRYSMQGEVSIAVHDNWELIPSVQLESQDNFRKYMGGLMLRYNNPFKGDAGTIIYGGVFTRLDDALILATGLEYSIYNFCISYDVNYSSLHQASYYQGGLELSLSIILNKQVKKAKREINCPVF